MNAPKLVAQSESDTNLTDRRAAWQACALDRLETALAGSVAARRR